MTAREAAKKIGVSRERLYQYLRAGKIQGPPKLGKRRRAWTISDVRAARAARKANVRPGPGGCKPKKRLDPRRIAALRRQGLSWPAIAEQLGACMPIVRREARRTFYAPTCKPRATTPGSHAPTAR
jgi:predicted DNA-binding transcriptional regulator AlpA